MDTPASEIMSRDPLTAQEGMAIEEALKLLLNTKITGMPVVDAKGKMIGIISEYDILAQISKSKHLKPEVFRKPITFSKTTDSVKATAPLSEIIERFITSKYRRLPVVDSSGKLVGIITRRDLMRVFYYRSKLL